MNKEAADILKLSFSPAIFALGARNILSESTKRRMETSADALRRIASECRDTDEKRPPAEDMERLYRRFRMVYRRPEHADFTARELRTLIYTMFRMRDKGMVASFVSLLDSNWRNSFLNGLLYFVLSEWDDADEADKGRVLELIRKRLKVYDGHRDKYLILKRNMKFLALNGPELLGVSLRQQDKGQKVNCSLTTVSSVYFGLSRDRLDFPFYSRAIASYFEKDALNRMSLLERILQAHNYGPTARRLIPSLVLGAGKDRRIAERQKEQIHTLAVRLIGDPLLDSKWEFPEGSAEEKENLHEAQAILKEWIKQKFITIFFEKLVNEPKRKNFWLKHTDLVWDFDVYCTKGSKALLMQDSRLSSIIESKVSLLADNTDKDAALGMYIGDYYLVEFSNVGSIYIYRNPPKNPRYYWELKSPRLKTMQSFLVGFLTMNEGKLPHNPGWEDSLCKWLACHGVNVENR